MKSRIMLPRAATAAPMRSVYGFNDMAVGVVRFIETGNDDRDMRLKAALAIWQRRYPDQRWEIIKSWKNRDDGLTRASGFKVTRTA